MKVRSARRAARYVADQRVVRGSAECELSSCSAVEKSGQGERNRRIESVREQNALPYGGMRNDGNRISGNRKPDIAVSLARRAKGFSESASSRRF